MTGCNQTKKDGKPEFVDPERILPWRPVEGLASGAWEIILFKDEQTGTYARLLRLDPGHKGSKTAMVHEFDEVVYNLSGELVNDLTGESYGPKTFAYFPAGKEHGPFSSPVGNSAIEFRYYKPRR